MDWAFGFWFLMCTSQILSQHILARQPKWRATDRNLNLSKAGLGRRAYYKPPKNGVILDWVKDPETGDFKYVERSTKGSISKTPSRLTTRRAKKRRTRPTKTTKWSTKKLNFTRTSPTKRTRKAYTTKGPDDEMTIRTKWLIRPTGTPIDDGGAAAWIWEKYVEGRLKNEKEREEAAKLAPNKLKQTLVPEPHEEDLLYVQESSEGPKQLLNLEDNYNMIQDREDLPLNVKFDGEDSSHEETDENELYTAKPRRHEVFNGNSQQENTNINQDDIESSESVNDETDDTVKDQGSRRQHVALQWQRGIVPFEIDTEIYDDIIIKRILHAMKVIESASCVTFENLSDQKYRTRRFEFRLSYLRITNTAKKRDCVHRIDFGPHGEAVLVLGFDCMTTRDIVHSLMHALGFMDEITHPQRDAYVRVLWENIQPKYRYLFAIQNVTLPHKSLVEYDTMSIMHFHDRAYSINGGATIAPTVPGLLIQPSKSLSQLDKMKLRLAFGQECNKRKVEALVETCKFALGDSGTANGGEVSFEQDNSENKYELNDLLDHNVIDNSVDFNQLVPLDHGQDDDQQNAIDSGSDYNQQDVSVNDQNNNQHAIDNGSDYNQQNDPDDGRDDNHYSKRDNGQVDN